MPISQRQLAAMLFISSIFIDIEAISVFIKKADETNGKGNTNRDDATKTHRGGCKYADYCRYFDANSIPCLKEEIASSDCGSYDLFDNFIVKKSRHLSL